MIKNALVFNSKPALALLFFVSGLQLFAQTSPYQIDLPQMLPASPEASLFVKAGFGGSNMSTGAATANIPLYTIKIKDFTFPIGLAYSTQGLKADEASSRVGYGWTLNAGGAITRSVKGEPDEFSQRLLPTPTDFTATTDDLFNYYLKGSTSGGGYDTQPDEFQFHVNGYSGKFVLDYNKTTGIFTPRLTSASNVIINVSILNTPQSTAGGISSIVLKTPDGVTYTFGTNYEISSDHTLAKYSSYKNVIKTAFFLDRIDLPAGENILFNYSQIQTQAAIGLTQSLTYSMLESAANCTTCPSSQLITNYDRVSYNTRLLQSITTSSGLTVNLGYTNRVDMSQDVRLATLEVVGVKQYAFEYFDLPNQSQSMTGRFFLTKVSDITMPGPGSLNYVLGYEQMESVPLPITFSQDYLGYYNGSGISYFIPPNIVPNTTVDFSFRNPNSDYSKLGTLISIQYPTGGTEQYIYEANTYSQSITIPPPVYHYTLQGAGGGSSGSSSPVTYTLNNITVPYDQTVTINFQTAQNGNYTVDYIKPNGFTLYDGVGAVVSHSISEVDTYTTTAQLLAGHTYSLSMTIQTYELVGNCDIAYQLTNTPTYQNVNTVLPGVRLKQLNYTDPQGATNNYSKYYTYASLANLNNSSGGFYGGINYQSNIVWQSYCNGGTLNIPQQCNVFTYSSSSSSQVYNYAGSGSLIYYTSVIESNDPNFANGGTEYVFYPNDDGSNYATMLGGSIQYLSSGQYPTLSGVLNRTTKFDNHFNTVESEENTYEQIVDRSTQVSSVYIRKNWDPVTGLATGNDPTYSSIRMTAFDVAACNYNNYWLRLKSKRVTVVDPNNNSQFTQTTYNYGDASNIQPSSTVMVDSKGNNWTTNMIYPNTYVASVQDAATPGYNALQARGIITPVVVQASYLNGSLQQLKQVFYKDWFSNGVVVDKQKIQVQESPSDLLHDALIFDQYSPSGNLQQLHRANDLNISYLWDETLSLPISEVKNATAGQIAYTSFENNANGNWTLSGSTSSGSSFTGKKSFTGTLTANTTIAGTYIVTLWTTATSPSVNGAAGSLITTSRGWNLYQWTVALSGPGVVTVSGTALDEVRLFPSGSLMKTFTYKPFVGMIASNDENNKVTYFSYDALGRLKTVIDADGNILKNSEYHYMFQPISVLKQ